MDNPAQMTDMEVRERVINLEAIIRGRDELINNAASSRIAELEKFKDYYQELVEARGYYGITDLLVADTKHKERIAELEKERIKLLSCLLDISNECIGEITMNYRVDSEFICGRIQATTGMTRSQLGDAVKGRGK